MKLPSFYYAVCKNLTSQKGKNVHILSVLLLYLSCQGAALAEENFTRLAPGDPERKDMLNAARLQSADDLNIDDANRILFTVSRNQEGALFCRSGDWAILSATAGTVQQDTWVPVKHNCGEADLLSIFLLNKNDGKWIVRRGGSICATDVFWIDWRFEEEIRKYVPGELFRCFEESP